MAKRVAVTAGRRHDEQAALLGHLGLEVVSFPLLRTAPEGAAALQERTEQICARPPAYFVANTGYGMRSWFKMAAKWGLLEQLVNALSHESAIAARGAKALGELRKVGLDAFYKAGGGTLDEVADRLLEEDLVGKEVVVQLHGERQAPSLGRLAEAGARLGYLSVYRTAGAGGATASALVKAVVGGKVQAVTFTAAPQLQVLFEGAGPLRPALVAAFNEGGVVAACIGPVCAAEARAQGIAEPLVPPHPRLGALAKALAQRLAAQPDVTFE